MDMMSDQLQAFVMERIAEGRAPSLHGKSTAVHSKDTSDLAISRHRFVTTVRRGVGTDMKGSGIMSIAGFGLLRARYLTGAGASKPAAVEALGLTADRAGSPHTRSRARRRGSEVGVSKRERSDGGHVT